jgi:hypothetical protein
MSTNDLPLNLPGLDADRAVWGALVDARFERDAALTALRGLVEALDGSPATYRAALRGALRGARDVLDEQLYGPPHCPADCACDRHRWTLATPPPAA